MTHIKRIDEMNNLSESWKGKDFFDFVQLKEEPDLTNRKLGATYLLSDNMGTLIDRWRVAVFVKNTKEEKQLKDLCWEQGFMRFDGGEEIYDFGKHEVENYPKTITTQEFIKMFDEEQKGMHTLHFYYENR